MRGNTARTRNARLAALHTFFRYVLDRDPAHAALCQRVLAIPVKKATRPALGYLSAEEFRLRAAFLSLYWLVFILGGLIVNRAAMSAAERNGLLTLNNVFFFMLFSLFRDDRSHAHG